MPDSWWRTAAIYQLYTRSFADGTGDGIGDLAGARDRLPYLAGLGVDAIWFNPWYASPMADAGYDISDYRAIEPAFGTLADADALIAEAHALGIKIIIDVVPNHGSHQHPWFTEALAARPGSRARDRFWFRDGRGPGGDEPPNNWQSIFGGGSAWTRVTGPDGSPGQWYLHLFAPEQPDFNWGSPEVRAEFEDVLRFWFDRGVDGIRIDSAALLTKDPALPDVSPDQPPGPDHPFTDRDDVHGIYRSWRAIADEKPGRVLIGEIWLPDAQRLAAYVQPGELHTVFNFPYLSCPWDAAALRECIERTLALNAPHDAPATWVLSNHDVDRPVSRYGRADTHFDLLRRRYLHGFPVDLALGTRRARAAALLTLALPGSVYIYQGEELGLWEVLDIPDELRQDPMWHRTGGEDPGRDGCRVPLPWSEATSPFGFSPPGSACEPWLPQPKEWRDYTVAAQSAAPGSMLALYREGLAMRGSLASFRMEASLEWLPAGGGVIAFARGDAACVTNLSGTPVPLPHGELLLASAPLEDGLLPPDTTAWLRVRTSR